MRQQIFEFSPCIFAGVAHDVGKVCCFGVFHLHLDLVPEAYLRCHRQHLVSSLRGGLLRPDPRTKPRNQLTYVGLCHATLGFG